MPLKTIATTPPPFVYDPGATNAEREDRRMRTLLRDLNTLLAFAMRNPDDDDAKEFLALCQLARLR